MKIPRPVLLDQEMDRKDFLRHVGVAMLLLLGGNMVMGALTGLTKLDNSGAAEPSRRGYGDSRYGG